MIDEKHVMLDLETWGTAAGCAIRSIGAVQFCPETGTLGQEFYANIDDVSCMELGLVKDPGTVAWWGRQSREAQDSLLKNRMPVGLALKQFTEYWKMVGADYVWSQGGNFDEPILSCIYSKLQRKTPWKFAASRDTRTSYHYGQTMGGFFSHGVKREGTYHNALDDAKHQARCVYLATSAIRRGRSTEEID